MASFRDSGNGQSGGSSQEEKPPHELAAGHAHETDDRDALLARIEELEQALAEHQETVRALAVSEERYTLAVRGSNNGLWDWDVASNKVEYAPRFKALLGYEEHEMSNDFEEFSSRLHPDDLEPTMAEVRAHLEDEVPYDVEYRLRHKDGEFRWFRARGLAVRDADGNPTRMAGSITDITPRKDAERELELTSNRLLVATKAGAIGIWDYDVVNNILVWDERMYELYGVSADRFSGAYEAWEEGLHPDDLEGEREKLQQALRGEAEFDTEFRVVWPEDQSIHHIKANGKVLRDESGEPVRMIGTNWDFTEKKLAEDELRLAKQKAEDAAKAKSEFLANMSHEIRTPMNGVIGMTELLLGTDLTDTQREYQLVVRNSADSLLSILNDILDFSKIEAGKLSLESVDFHLRDRVGDSLRTLGTRASEKGIELAYQIDPEVPDHLLGDTGRVQQILVNLVGNAIKFTERGEVVVNVRLDSRDDEMATLHFIIRDTGIGISPEKQGLIFESFTQAESSTTRRFGGTGLGLAISRQLVDLMNGQLWVESELGSGSTFHFTVELQVAPGEVNGDRIAPVSLSGKRVLVVDDNATNRRILGDLSRSWEMEAKECSSGAEAVELVTGKAGDQPYDIIFMDYMMPGMDGLETAKQIGEHLGEMAPPVLMLSSADVLQDADELEALGIARRITKPAKPSDILNAINDLFGEAGGGEDDASYSLGTRPENVPAMHILLAEDGKVNQMVATKMLENRGHSVEIAENGRQALALCKFEPFDAVLMDVQMPEMNGLEATAAIRSSEAGKDTHIPIIAMTANAMKGDREACLDAGMDDYVAKPVRAAELIEAVEKFAR